jgi:hypothetical protein
MEESKERIELNRIRETLSPPSAFAPADHFLPVDRMQDALLDDDAPNAPLLKNGITASANGVVHVATSVLFPSCKPDHLAWWFGGGCKGDEEYRRWHPEDHVSGYWFRGTDANDASTTVDTHQPWIGCEHRVVEALGAKLGGLPLTLRIKFCDPNHYGIDQNMLKQFNVKFAFTARVCIQDAGLGWLDVGHFIHFTKPLPADDGGIASEGFELRSRFWLGDVAISNDSTNGFLKRSIISPIVRTIANTRVIRYIASRVIEGRSQLQVAIANWTHAVEEFSVLASFLKEAYEASKPN